MSEALKQLKFDWTISLGNLLSMLTIVAGLLAYVSHITERITTIRRDVDVIIERGSPHVGALAASDQIQNERIKMLTEGYTDMRKAQTELMSILLAIREDIVILKTRSNIDPLTDKPRSQRRGEDHQR
ncbi:hypothetical protein [Enterovirga aerilata]|uniref:DUF2730 family protein n=1 Tax=Enterovirga aerilata TaxID=2730920 RepID=A0A849I4I7_9HYPH|nr:hypothetical protein [Enterovirga sp. DB1703]NNM74746.1 hypothetical protein [Enterovirga sp. DB1703]